MLEVGIPRQGPRLFNDGQEIGFMTSGTFSPLLKIGIVMGHATPELQPGDKVSVEIHGKPRTAEVVSWPFDNPERYDYSRR